MKKFELKFEKGIPFDNCDQLHYHMSRLPTIPVSTASENFDTEEEYEQFKKMYSDMIDSDQWDNPLCELEIPTQNFKITIRNYRK